MRLQMYAWTLSALRFVGPTSVVCEASHPSTHHSCAPVLPACLEGGGWAQTSCTGCTLVVAAILAVCTTRGAPLPPPPPPHPVHPSPQPPDLRWTLPTSPVTSLSLISICQYVNLLALTRWVQAWDHKQWFGAGRFFCAEAESSLSLQLVDGVSSRYCFSGKMSPRRHVCWWKEEGEIERKCIMNEYVPCALTFFPFLYSSPSLLPSAPENSVNPSSSPSPETLKIAQA